MSREKHSEVCSTTRPLPITAFYKTYWNIDFLNRSQRLKFDHWSMERIQDRVEKSEESDERRPLPRFHVRGRKPRKGDSRRGLGSIGWDKLGNSRDVGMSEWVIRKQIGINSSCGKRVRDRDCCKVILMPLNLHLLLILFKIRCLKSDKVFWTIQSWCVVLKSARYNIILSA